MTLLKRDHNAPTAWFGEMPVTSRYTAGLAGERFLRAIQEGRLLGTFCPHCDHVYVPPAVFCERCMDELKEWVDVGTMGIVHTFTAIFEDLDGEPLKAPEVIAFVRFGDGGIVHRLLQVDSEDVYIGMPVRVMFKPKAKRQGSILDILGFKPLD